jgi:hypothetical protein
MTSDRYFAAHQAAVAAAAPAKGRDRGMIALLLIMIGSAALGAAAIFIALTSPVDVASLILLVVGTVAICFSLSCLINMIVAGLRAS